MRILLLFFFVTLAACGRGVLTLANYPEMYRDADLVAIVRFADLKDTSRTKELTDLTSKPSGLHFRELNGHIEIVSLLKGTVDSPAMCRLYRFPSFEECSKDLGSEDDARIRLSACVRDFGLVHVFWPGTAKDIRDIDFLVYFKKASDGFYIPVTGDADSQSSIRELAPARIFTQNKQEAQSGPRD